MVQGNVLGRKPKGEGPSIYNVNTYVGNGASTRDFVLSPNARYVIFYSRPLNSLSVTVDLDSNKWSSYTSDGTNLGANIGPANMGKVGDTLRFSGATWINASGVEYTMLEILA